MPEHVRRKASPTAPVVWALADPDGEPEWDMVARVFSWDRCQQPDMEAIAAFVAELSGGKVTMREVDTGSDEYAWVIADREVSDDEAMELYGNG